MGHRAETSHQKERHCAEARVSPLDAPRVRGTMSNLLFFSRLNLGGLRPAFFAFRSPARRAAVDRMPAICSASSSPHKPSDLTHQAIDMPVAKCREYHSGIGPLAHDAMLKQAIEGADL